MKKNPNRNGRRTARQIEKAGWMFLVLLVFLLIFGSWIILDDISGTPSVMEATDEDGMNGTEIFGRQGGTSR